MESHYHHHQQQQHQQHDDYHLCCTDRLHPGQLLLRKVGFGAGDPLSNDRRTLEE
jgi:hypothetical protein